MLLHRKLMLISVTLFSLLFALIVTLEVHYSRDHLRQQLNQHLQVTADQLELLLTPALARGDTRAAAQLFARWPLVEPGLQARLELPDERRALLRASPPQQAAVPAWFADWIAPDSAALSRTMATAARGEARLRVTGDTRAGYLALWRQTYQLTLWFGLSLLLAMLMLLYAVRRSLAPLESLRQHLDQLNQPRFGQPLPAPAIVDLRPLVESFNALSERLRVTFARQAEEIESLRRAAYQDRLTGLANRAFFNAEMEQWMAEPGEGGVLFMQLYQLEALYRERGFACRDQLLNETAEQLRALRRVTPNVLVARLSDSEFALLMPGFDPEQVDQLAETLHQRMRLICEPLGGRFGGLYAIGAALRLPGCDAAALLAQADAALQQARQQNLQPLRVLSGLEQPPALGRGAWRALLQRAIADGCLHYQLQPVLRMNGKVRALELLSEIRIDGQRYPAAQFMPFVEQLGLGAALDRCVLEQITPQLGRHRVPLIVNLSEHALGDVAFVSWLGGWLEANRALQRWIGFELPEAAQVSNPGGLAACSALLRRRGVGFGIDRIGPHLEQLRELVALGPDYLKLDRSLVLATAADDKGFIRSLARMAHDLDIDLVTLRVEQEAQLAAIAERAMDGYQGYIRKPIPLKLAARGYVA